MFDNWKSCSSFVQKYRAGFSRCNVTANTLWELNAHAEIYCTYTRRENGKIVQQHRETVSAETYANVCSSVPCFANRVQKSYTPFGYIATRFTARSPYDDTTVVRSFEIYCK